jgi:hypothetical protein
LTLDFAASDALSGVDTNRVLAPADAAIQERALEWLGLDTASMLFSWRLPVLFRLPLSMGG